MIPCQNVISYTIYLLEYNIYCELLEIFSFVSNTHISLSAYFAHHILDSHDKQLSQSLRQDGKSVYVSVIIKKILVGDPSAFFLFHMIFCLKYDRCTQINLEKHVPTKLPINVSIC